MFIQNNRIKFDKKADKDGTSSEKTENKEEKSEKPELKPDDKAVNIMQPNKSDEKIVYKEPDLKPVMEEMGKITEKLEKLIPNPIESKPEAKPIIENKKQDKDVVELLGELL